MSELHIPTSDTMSWATVRAGDGLTDRMVADLYAATANEQMIPLTEDKLAEHPIGVAVSRLGRIAGYTGITSEYVLTDEQGQRHRALEVGGAVVMPEFY